MSTRRTRSGTPLGGNVEPRRLRQTPVRKQQSVKASEEATLSQALDNTADKSPSAKRPEQTSRKAAEKNVTIFGAKSTSESPDKNKKQIVPTANIWERLETDNDMFNGRDDIDIDKEVTDDGSNVKAGAALGDKSVPPETAASKTQRKPEILVSLLESEAGYSTSLVKSGIGCRFTNERRPEDDTDNPKYLRERQYTSIGGNSRSVLFTECTSSAPVCFFPHCEYHKSGDGTSDFLHMPEVPGEPFFVSLSKDKNKELNMVKTSSGTVRVGCGLRRFVHQSQASTESCVKHALSIPGISKDGGSQEKPLDDKGGDRPRTLLFSSESKVSTVKIDEDTDGKLGGNLKTLGQHTDSAGAAWTNGATPENEQCTSTGELFVENAASAVAWGNESASGKLNDSDSCQILSDLEYETAPPGDVSSQQGSAFIADNISGQFQFHPRSFIPNTTSQYPLMKEILTEQNYTSTASTTVCIHEPPVLYGTPGVMQPKKTVSLLKPSAASLTTLPSLLAVESGYETKSVVKRSERIRCKSGLSTLATVPHHQSVISTMKPADKKSKSKAKSQISKKKSKSSVSKEVQKKKNKKCKVEPKKTAPAKKSKDFSKAKATMSREVMDAIVQSIEETVSRGRDERQTEAVLESTSSDSSFNMNSVDYNSHQGVASSTETSQDSTMTDHWSDGANVHDDNDSMNSVDLALTPQNRPVPIAHTSASGTIHSRTAKSKKSAQKSKKSKKGCHPSSHSSKSKPMKLKVCKSSAITTTTNTTNTPVMSATISSEDVAGEEPPGVASSDATGVASIAGKRFRRKTRKAEEAFGDYDVFCDEEWPVKKSKSKKRSSSASCDSATASGPRRPRRSSQAGGLMADPVLEEHAFILWASENRSQLELQHPGASTCEVDAILSSRWCDVTDSVKARFFFRAREAFSDDDRHMIRSSTMADLESGAFGDFFTDHDPVFTEFIRLSIDRQRELLRKWLKFFQKMLPKKEYIEFIVTFKRACGRDTHSPSGKPKRTRMRCLDPSYYKMLFDMIRLTKPRVLEVYREKRGKEKKIVTDTYSLMLHKLVNDEPWPHMVTGCRSQALTQILQDLSITTETMEAHVSRTPNGAVATFVSAHVNTLRETTLGTIDDEYEDDGLRSDDDVGGVGSLAHLKNSSGIHKAVLLQDCKIEQCEDDFNMDEMDYGVLSTDLAQSLLSGLSEITDLPILDQDTLDQVFLAPPPVSATPASQRRTVSVHSRRLDTAPSHPAIGGSLCQPRLLPPDTMSYSKMSVHFPPTNMPISSGMVVHHIPSTTSSSALQPHKYLPRDVRDGSAVRTVCCRKDSPMDMHTYSITMENMLQPSGRLEGPHSKCIKVHSKAGTPQARLSLHPLQLPINSRTHQSNKLHPRVVPVSCSYQQRFPAQIFPPTSAAMLDKFGSHHVYHMGTSLPGSAPTTPSRMYPHPLGMSTPSPLITSLSPLRNIKYTQSSKLYNTPHCQMMPYKPRMQLTAGTSGHGHRKTTHTIPISTTLKSGNTRSQGGLQQIKVCLPTQALKIPIAKLRGSRKTSYLKGKVKNLNMQSALEPLSNLPCSQTCQYNVRASPPSSVLAKVLSYQASSETEQFSKTSISDAISSIAGVSTKPTTTTFIGTIRPVSVQPITSGLRSPAQLQIVTMVSNSAQASDVRATMSTQTAVVVSPLTWRRNSLFAPSTCPSSTIQTTTGLCGVDQSSPTYSNSVLKVQPSSSSVPGRTIHHLATQMSPLAPDLPDCDSVELQNAQVPNCFDMDDSTAEFIVVGTCTASPSRTNKDSEHEGSVQDSTLSSLVSDDSAVGSWSCGNTFDESVGEAQCHGSSSFEDTGAVEGSGSETENHLTLDTAPNETAYPKTAFSDQHCPGVTTSSNTWGVGNIMRVLCGPDLSTAPSLSLDESGFSDSQPPTSSSQPTPSTNTKQNQKGISSSTSSYCLSTLLMRDTSYEDSDSSWQCRCPSCETNRASVQREKQLNASAKMGVKISTDEQEIITRSRTPDFSTADRQQLVLSGHRDVNTATTTASKTAVVDIPAKSVEVSSFCSCTNDTTDYCTGVMASPTFNVNSDSNRKKTGNPLVSVTLPSTSDKNYSEQHLATEDPVSSVLQTVINFEPQTVQAQCPPQVSSQQNVTEIPLLSRTLLSSQVERQSLSPKTLSGDTGCTKKADEPSVSDPGPLVKKISKCSVTVQPDTGCILAATVATLDKTATQTMSANSDPRLSVMTVTSATAPAVSIPVSISQTVTATVSVAGTGQTLMTQQQRSVRTTAVASSHAYTSVTVTANSVSHAPSSVTQSPSGGRKRAHYVHEYLPT